jgi:HlyD family secretion protein
MGVPDALLGGLREKAVYRWSRPNNERLIWEASDVLKVPGSATFRDRNGWSAFVVDRGRARQRNVQIGHRNQAEAEITGGIAAGEQVILYPSNQLHDGDRVRTQ